MILDLILSIFGGGYYAGRYLYDKNKEMQRDRASAAQRYSKILFESKYEAKEDPFLSSIKHDIRCLTGEFENAREDSFAVFEPYRKDIEYIYNKEIATPYLYLYYFKELAMLIYADRGKLASDLISATFGYVITSDDGKRLLQRVEERFNKATSENIRFVAHRSGYLRPEKGYAAGFCVTIEEFILPGIPFWRMW